MFFMKLSSVGLVALLTLATPYVGSAQTPTTATDEQLDSRIAASIPNDPTLKTDAIKVKVGNVVDKTKEIGSKTGEVTTDGWISTRIKTNFMGEEMLRQSDIKVDTDDHVVTLSGSVVSAAARAKAISIAKGVEGVHRVVDKLTV